MTHASVASIAQVASQSFQSFAHASRAVLDALSDELPGDTLVVSQHDHNEGEYRILDARPNGMEGVEAGTTLPLESTFCFQMANDHAPRLTGDTTADPVYGGLESRQGKDVRSYVGVPLEMSDGNRVGSLCAMSSSPDRFDDGDLEYMSVLGRILAYEFERVKRERELRRLREEVRRQDVADPLTGVLHRRGFLEQLEREWDLARGGAWRPGWSSRRWRAFRASTSASARRWRSADQGRRPGAGRRGARRRRGRPGQRRPVRRPAHRLSRAGGRRRFRGAAPHRPGANHQRASRLAGPRSRRAAAGRHRSPVAALEQAEAVAREPVAQST